MQGALQRPVGIRLKGERMRRRRLALTDAPAVLVGTSGTAQRRTPRLQSHERRQTISEAVEVRQEVGAQVIAHASVRGATAEVHLGLEIGRAAQRSPGRREGRIVLALHVGLEQRDGDILGDGVEHL
eukprot:4826915-Prymnesium_polylepis.1